MRLARWLLRAWPVRAVALVIVVFVLRACLHVDAREVMTEVASSPGDPPGTRAYVGTLHMERAGAFLVGVETAAPAVIVVDGVRATTETIRGISRDGTVAFRAALPAGARVVWEPVGRRGVGEYITAHDLDPARARVDGWCALALLGIAVGSVLRAQRERLLACPRPVLLAALGVFALALVVRLIGLGAAGQTWDEAVYVAAGKNAVTNVLALDLSPSAWRANLEHPPITKLLLGVAHGSFTGARVISALCASLAGAMLVPIGARLFRPRVGALAGVTAALLPPLVAHGQVAGHESVSLALGMLAMVLALGVHDRIGPHAYRALAWRLVGVGIAVGFAAASRFIAALVIVPCVMAVVRTRPAITLPRLPLVGLAALATFVAVWPHLWPDPIAALSESFAVLARPHPPEWFLGEVTASPPAYYFVVYLVATAPVGMLVAAVFGGVRALLERTWSHLVLLAMLVAPLGVSFSPVRQDGVRYVLPAITALALLAAVGIDWLARSRRAFIGASLALALYLAITLGRIAPYYLDYFGELAGGPAVVQERRTFETAWWGEGLDRAVAYVNTHATDGERVYPGCILPSHLAWFDAEVRGDITRTQDDATWVVTYEGAYACAIAPGLAPVFAVTARGAVIARVYRRM